MIKPLHTLLLLVTAAVTSCGNQANEQDMAAAEAAKPRSMSERFNSRSKEGYYQDSEGNWKANNAKRSSFESVGRSEMANQQYSGKAYQTKEVERRSWWGDTRYQKPVYAQATQVEQFQTKARAQGQMAPEASQSSSFAGQNVTTNRLAKRNAMENGAAQISERARTARESVSDYAEPDIIDWKEQRTLKIRDTKSMLNK